MIYLDCMRSTCVTKSLACTLILPIPNIAQDCDNHDTEAGRIRKERNMRQQQKRVDWKPITDFACYC